MRNEFRKFKVKQLLRSSAMVAIGLTTGLSLASCSSSPKQGSSAPQTSAAFPKVTSAQNASARKAFYVVPSDLRSAPAGSLIRSQQVTGLAGVPKDSKVWRIMFHSRTIYNKDIAQSGYAMLPSGRKPTGGYPTIAWAHGTSGFSAPCGPSWFDASGPSGLYLVPQLGSYLSAGFAIAAADYQGLGISQGIHPYLLGLSEGRSVLDASRATQELARGELSKKVIIYGHSQGGHAALFAGEIAPRYAPDLQIAGVVAAAPATGLSTLISVVSSDIGAGFMPFSIPTAWAWSTTYKDLPSSSLFTPAGITFAKAAISKGCSSEVGRAITQAKLTPATVFSSKASSNPVVMAHAKLNDPGRVKTNFPMLIIQGTADGTVPPALTDSFVSSAACPMGDRVEYLHAVGADHGSVVFVSAPKVLSWMQDRLSGIAATTTCGQPGDASNLP